MLLRVLYGTVTVTVMRSGVPGDHFVMYTGLDGGIAARRVTAWLDVRGYGCRAQQAWLHETTIMMTAARGCRAVPPTRTGEASC